MTRVTLVYAYTSHIFHSLFTLCLCSLWITCRILRGCSLLTHYWARATASVERKHLPPLSLSRDRSRLLHEDTKVPVSMNCPVHLSLLIHLLCMCVCTCFVSLASLLSRAAHTWGPSAIAPLTAYFCVCCN